MNAAGRLAFIHEEGFINVYLASSDASIMDDGVLLGSIAIAFTEDEEIYRRFKELYMEGVQKYLNEMGVNTEWGAEQQARKPQAGHG